jgi:hypothetical protein
MRLSCWKIEKTSTCTRVEYFECCDMQCHSRWKDAKRLIGYANEDMAEFVRGAEEVSCNCDTAAAWKGGSENGEQERYKEERSGKHEKKRKESTRQ